MEIKPEQKLQDASLVDSQKSNMSTTVQEFNEANRAKPEAQNQEKNEETSNKTNNQEKEQTQEEIKDYLEK